MSMMVGGEEDKLHVGAQRPNVSTPTPLHEKLASVSVLSAVCHRKEERLVVL